MITKYDIIHESLQEKVYSHELTVEEAERIDEIAFEKFSDVVVVEKKVDEDIQLLDRLKDLLMNGQIKLTGKDRDRINALLASSFLDKNQPDPSIAPDQAGMEDPNMGTDSNADPNAQAGAPDASAMDAAVDQTAGDMQNNDPNSQQNMEQTPPVDQNVPADPNAQAGAQPDPNDPNNPQNQKGKK